MSLGYSWYHHKKERFNLLSTVHTLPCLFKEATMFTLLVPHLSEQTVVILNTSNDEEQKKENPEM